MLVLVALIIRGVSFEWRARVDTPRWRGTWSWTLTVGSALVPLLLGVALGDLLVGLPIAASNEFTGTFWSLLTPYGLWLGLTLLVLCLLHGATFLVLKAGGVVRERSGRLAGRLSWPSLLLVVVYAGWTVSISGGGLWRVIAVAVPAIAAVGAMLLIRAGFEGASFTATAVALGGTVEALVEPVPGRDGLLDKHSEHPHGGRHGLRRLRPEGDDRRRRCDVPGGPALPGVVVLAGVVVLGLPGSHQRTGRVRRRDGSVAVTVAITLAESLS